MQSVNEKPSSPKCLLQIIPNLDAGGAERACLDIAHAVHVQGWRSLVVSEGGRLAVELAALGGELIKMPVASKNPVVLLANAFRLARLIRARGVDLIHVRSRAPAWSAWLASGLTGVPMVATFHGLYGAQNACKRLYNSVMLRGARVIAGSNFMAAHIQSRYRPPADRIAIIPRGIDLERFDPAAVHQDRVRRLLEEWKIPHGSRIILLPARLTRWKGQLLLVDALATLNRTDVVGVLTGDAQGRDAYVSEIRARAQLQGVSDRLRIAGHVADMPAAYAAADIVVSASSDAEAFGRVPVEAMAMGCSIIAADHGGASETLRTPDGRTSFGTLVAPGNVGALRAGLTLALAAPRGGGAERARAARAHVEARYSTQAMCDQTLALYRAVLAGP